MNRKITVFMGLLGIFVVLLGSCNNDSEENRSVVIVSAMNGNAPFFSDVLDQGDTLYVGGVPFTQDDFVQEDWIPVTFFNRPFNSIGTTGPGAPLSDFLITRYQVEYSRVGGTGTPLTSVPTTYMGAMSAQVPSNSFVTTVIVLVPFEEKNAVLLSNINYLNVGFPSEIQTIATVTFWGHEVGTSREWSFQGQLSVNFADPVVKSEK